jgi:Tol biopolymer transport system component
MIFALVFSLLTVCTAQPTAVPLTEITEAPKETIPIPTATLIPQDSEYAQQVMQVHEISTMMYATIELINETALRVSQDAIDPALTMTILTDISAHAHDMEQVYSDYQAPAEFFEAWSQQYDAYSINRQIVNQWLAEEIGPNDVMHALVPVREESDTSLDSMDELVVQLFGVDPAALAAHREYARNLTFENVFGQQRTACDGAEPVQAGTGKGEQIAFVSDRQGSQEIYIVNDDGTGLSAVTSEGLGAFGPSWSPDGSRIAFFSYRDGNGEIYVTNEDGSGLTRLTENPADDFAPSWSPDGTKIVFHTHRYGDNPQVAVMNSDGTNVVRLTSQIGGWSPVYSPNGDQVVFNSSYGPSRDIWIMNADGSDPTKITFASEDDWWPDWSPDGALIVFHSNRDGNSEIYTVDPLTYAESRLTESPGEDYDPAWSPDGSRIAFTSNEGQFPDICIMNADGSGMVNLTDSPAKDLAPVWRP